MIILVVAAYERELQVLRKELSNTPISSWKTRTVSCGERFEKTSVGKQRHDFILATTGVGTVNAAMALQHYIDQYAPDLIIATGVAASLNTNIQRKQSLLINAIYLLQDTSQELDHPIPCPLANRVFGNTAPPEWLQCGPALTGACIFRTLPPATLEYYKAMDIRVYDMESFAYAHVARTNATPYLIIRTISDCITPARRGGAGEGLAETAREPTRIVSEEEKSTILTQAKQTAQASGLQTLYIIGMLLAMPDLLQYVRQ